MYHKDKLLSEDQKPDVYKIFDSIVADVPAGSNKVIFAPWLFGERAPVEDPTVRGGLFNIGLNVDRRHILRAIFEGVAMNSRWVLEFEEKLSGSRFESVNLIGGGATSDIWCQIYADILNRPVNQIDRAKQANSIGAAFIASVALGEIQWNDISQLVHFKHTYTPQPENREIYDQLFKEFVHIYYNNKKMYRRLNKF